MSGNNLSIGARLQKARKDIGLSQQVVADRLGIPRSAVSEIESGRRKVSGIELTQLAKLYHCSIAELVSEEAGTASTFSVLFRAEELEDADRPAIKEFQRLCEQYRWLEKTVGAPDLLPPLPQYEYPGSPPSHLYATAEYIANKERQRLGLDTAPIGDMVALLEEKIGAKVFCLEFMGRKVSGAFTFGDDIGLCILVNRNHRRSRRSFSLAHEYAHALTDRKKPLGHISQSKPEGGKRPAMERHADAFAAAFLMPRLCIQEKLEEILDENSGKFFVEDVFRLQQFFGVSFQAMLWRLVTIRVLRREKAQELIEEVKPEKLMSKMGISTKPKSDRRPEQSLPSRFIALAIKACKRHEISFAKLKELLEADERLEGILRESWNLDQLLIRLRLVADSESACSD